jgi:Bacterial regulatory proteins, tetR family
MEQPDGDGARDAADQPGAAAGADTGERPDRNLAWGEATRAQLIAIATRMFAERGYEDTSIEAVLREAGVSRGSLPPLRQQGGLVRGRRRGGGDQHGGQDSRRGQRCRQPGGRAAGRVPGLDRLAGDPVVQRILLIDGPAVLGWDRWRSMEERHALGLVRSVLQIIADQGGMRPELVGTLAHVLLASVNEVALLVAQSDDKQTAMRDGAEAIDELLRRLFS